jgi:hypothetical protein
MNERKRRARDLRDFWPWYERNTMISEGHAEPPPFSLGDLPRKRPPSFRGAALLRAALLFIALSVAILLLRALFFA